MPWSLPEAGAQAKGRTPGKAAKDSRGSLWQAFSHTIMPPLPMPHWNNWSGRLQAQPSAIHFLRSEADACARVAATSNRGQHLRAVGAGHSHAPLVGHDDVIVDVSGLAGLISVDAAQHRARVWAGTPIYQLGRLLHEQGLALHNQGDIDRQTIGGAVSTGTHGTGKRLQNLSAAVTGFRLITHAGDVLECSAERNEALFTAARLSLGAFGLITQLELELLPSYRLREQQHITTLAAMLPRLDDLAERHRHFEFFWFPHNDRLVAKTIDETDTAAVYPLAAEGQRCAQSYEVLPNHRPDRHTEMEYSIPASVATDCLQALALLIQKDFPDVRWPIEYRWVAADEVWLSTAYQQDVVTLSVHQDISLDDRAYFSACEQLFLRYGGKPHWGKVHYLDEPQLAARHERWVDWWRVRDRLDPNDTFLNPYLRDLRPSASAVTSSTA